MLAQSALLPMHIIEHVHEELDFFVSPLNVTVFVERVIDQC